ncbi:Flap endonuclease 1 [Rhynchospora pubera]|uniref:Flap endonuclease 1 n=1 Tax=Rhynchospora pubera TaxID=906938 RepID=A0AAV8GUM9_9POAL|nr:Flap endonuclease 1 [Rhynchospora pubera]
MGVKHLWDILESCKKTLPLHHLQNKKLCVDLSCWLVQFATASRTPACMKEKVYLKNLFHRLRALIALNCSVIFVTDGAIPSIKLAAYRRRLGSQVLAEKASDITKPLPPVPSLRRNKGSEFSCMMKEAKMLGMALGIPSLDGIEEAEAQCASLNSASLCDGCFTSDSDVFLFGARTVYRDIILDSGYVVCYEMVDIERKLGLGRNSLISLALLLGSDYSNGVHGFGMETACRFVKSVGDDSVLDQMAFQGVAAIRKKRGKDRTDKDQFTEDSKNDVCIKSTNEEIGHLSSASQFAEVIDAYLNPKCHSPDSEAVQRACTDLPFLRSELQQLCEMFFGWSPEKTDEYILPKIAERDLRRYGNLRCTSSALGVDSVLYFSVISLCEKFRKSRALYQKGCRTKQKANVLQNNMKIPVPCPVSAIVKPRKVQGEEYYEVSWLNIEGSKVSSVPAALIQSACPEKIAEFISKKDEEKHNKHKRKPKPRKQSNKAPVSEVDKQLQELLITIRESEKNPLKDISDHLQQKYVKDIMEPDFFDLCTPSPPPRASKVAKCKIPIDQSVNLIEIIDSESDVSPGCTTEVTVLE